MSLNWTQEPHRQVRWPTTCSSSLAACIKLLVSCIPTLWRRNEFESGGTGPERKWGHLSGAKRRKKFWSCPSTFSALKVQFISRFGGRFRNGQYSLASFLFAVLLLAVPPCPAICKSGGHVPPCSTESAPLALPNRSTHFLHFYQTVCSGWPKNMVHLLRLISYNFIKYWSIFKLFHWQNRDKICSNTVTKDPTKHQVCRYATWCNVNVLKQQLKTRLL